MAKNSYYKGRIDPMAESFVAIYDILLKSHNLSAKFGHNFNENIIYLTRKFSPFYLKHGKQDALPLILLITFDVTNLFNISILVGFQKWKR